MLDSTVVRIFSGAYEKNKAPSVEDVVSSKIEFYAHVFLNACVKFGPWKKVGTAPYPDKIKVNFRASWDDGDPEVKVSHRWYVWRINETFIDIGTLTPEYHDAEIGCVLPPQVIAQRMQTGTFGMNYPSF